MDCSTWFLVVFKPKRPYPSPPRFLAYTVLRYDRVRVFCCDCIQIFAGGDVVNTEFCVACSFALSCSQKCATCSF
jgi:hypothetical protein